MTKKKTNREIYTEEARKLRDRIKYAESQGFIFSDEIKALLELPKRVTKQTIEKIKNLRDIKLRSEAIGYITNDRQGTVVSGKTGLRMYREEQAKRRSEAQIKVHETKKQEQEHIKVHGEKNQEQKPKFEEENVFDDLPTEWFIPKQEKIVLDNFESKLDDFENKLDSVEPQNKNSWQKEFEQQNLDSLREIYNNVKNDIGSNAMARVIEQFADKLNDILNRASYSYRSRDGAIHGYNPTLDETKFETILRQRVLTTDELKKANERQELGDYEEEFDEE